MPSDGSKTKQLIIKTAVRLFRENGYGSVSIQDICREAQIKRATFYYHFKSKDSILDNFYDNINTPPEYSSKIITTENCWLKLWLIIKPTIDWTTSMGDEILSTVFIMNFQNGGHTFFPLQEEFTKITILDIISKAQKNGQFANMAEALDIYHNIRNIIIGIAAVWCMKHASFDEEKEIHQAIAQLLQVQPALLEEESLWCTKLCPQ